MQQLVRDLDVPVTVVVGPTVREPDGLALSSRNQYLTADQRRAATVLFRSLQEAKTLIASGERDASAIRRRMVDCIASAPGAVLDYAEVVDADTLRPIDIVRGTVLAAVAVKFGNTRVIDNAVITV